MVKKKTFVVNRTKWLRSSNNESMLRDKVGRQCCLGFYLRACGMRAKDIDLKHTPMSISAKLPKQASWLIVVDVVDADDSLACGAIMAANDAFSKSDAEIEANLKKEFDKQGIKIMFKGPRRKLNQKEISK